MKDLLGMIPGMGKALKGVDIDDNSFKPVEAIIRSMTMQERENPDLINGSRKTRIDRKSTRLNSSHGYISYAVFCLKKKNKQQQERDPFGVGHRVVDGVGDLLRGPGQGGRARLRGDVEDGVESADPADRA